MQRAGAKKIKIKGRHSAKTQAQTTTMLMKPEPKTLKTQNLESQLPKRLGHVVQLVVLILQHMDATEIRAVRELQCALALPIGRRSGRAGAPE